MTADLSARKNFSNRQEKLSVINKEDFHLIQKLFKKKKTKRNINRKEIILS